VVDRSAEDLLAELLAWIRFSNRGMLAETLQGALADGKAFDVYEATDGTRTQNEIAKLANVSQPTVSRMWSRWRALGIVREVGEGQVAHLARPSDLGLARPS